MGSPYLSSNESIILSTNNVVVNTVPAEAILTNERLMLIDTRHAELRPQDIPFHAVETVIIGEDSNQDPMISLSIITGPGVTTPLGIIFPQPPKMKRVAERDEWAARLKELSIVSARENTGSRATEILPPWVPGPLPEEGGAGSAPAPQSETESKFHNPPLASRRIQKPAVAGNRTVITVVALVVAVIAVAAVAYLFAPSIFGKGGSAAPVPTPAPVTLQTTVPTPPPTTVATPAATPVVPTTPQVIIPQTGVFVKVTYEGTYSGSAGAPERMTNITSTGNTIRQLSVKDEFISATVQKLDNTGRTLTVELYSNGKLIKSGSISAPMGTVAISTDLRTS